MGEWILTEERQPDQPGKYEVYRRVGNGKTVHDEYRWNGGYWVTRGGSPSYAVHSWWDEKAEAD